VRGTCFAILEILTAWNDLIFPLDGLSGESEICVLLYMAAPETLHWRDRFNATPILHSADGGFAHTTNTLHKVPSSTLSALSSRPVAAARA
jgi:hypothetical protein